MTDKTAYERLAYTPGLTSQQVAEALQCGWSIQKVAQRLARPRRTHNDPFLTPADVEYPEPLRRLKVPPLRLFYRGMTPADLPPARVGIVGSRKATSYGKETARRLGRALAQRGVSVLSGLALGIDSAAHRGVIDEPSGASIGTPVAVLGHGWNHHYPRSNHNLREQVRRRGALLTEYPPNQPPARWTFPERNRIIAALSQHLVVVEAGPRSGSLYTAEFALDVGRTVWVVPNKPGYANSDGVLALLRDGATPLVNVEEFLEGVAPTPTGFEALAQLSGLSLEPEQRLVVRALLEGERTPTALAREAQCDPGRLAAILGELELAGLVTRCSDGWEPRPSQLVSQLVKEILKEGART